MKVMIEDATREQLLWFVQVKLGVDKTHPKTGIPKLTKLIKTMWAENYIELDAEHADGGDAGPRAERAHYEEPPVKTRKVDPLKFGAHDPLVKIRIHNSSGKGGSSNVPCHLNGVSFWIPRGKDVEIPYRNFMVLEESISTIHEGWDDDLGRNAEPREASAYTYSVLRRPSEEEIAKWNADLEPYKQEQREAKMRRVNRSRRIREDAHI